MKSLRSNEAITEIYNKYVETVYRIALMMLKSPSDAEDATQTVFIKLMTAETQHKSEEHMKAWLIVTTQNTCKDVLKSRWHSSRDDYENVAEQIYFPDDSLKDIWNRIADLDEKYKVPIYLHYYEGYKTEEIAKMLNENHATIRTRLRTAKAKLKLIIEEEGVDYDREKYN
ncbi:MAG: sigma-70 family RNA polymerase sigma factor [Oscillospiraceae bacterium]|nr:sigma-70 family RNA polymerase sigma factor [Oscillospiraceae bacterium]